MGICQKKKASQHLPLKKHLPNPVARFPTGKNNNAQPFPLLGFYQVEEEGVPETWASTTLVKWIRSLNMSFFKIMPRLTRLIYSKKVWICLFPIICFH